MWIPILEKEDNESLGCHCGRGLVAYLGKIYCISFGIIAEAQYILQYKHFARYILQCSACVQYILQYIYCCNISWDLYCSCNIYCNVYIAAILAEIGTALAIYIAAVCNIRWVCTAMLVVCI